MLRKMRYVIYASFSLFDNVLANPKLTPDYWTLPLLDSTLKRPMLRIFYIGKLLDCT
jgi:hypothetical protein